MNRHPLALLCWLGLSQPVLAEPNVSAEDTLQRSYEHDYGGECARMSPAPERRQSVSFRPDKGVTEPSGQAPLVEVRKIDQLLVPLRANILACGERIPPHPGEVSLHYDFRARIWSDDAKNKTLRECVGFEDANITR